MFWRSARGNKFKKASVDDAVHLHELQVKSFKSLLDKYQDYATNPGAERIDCTMSRLSENNSYYYFIQYNDINIGAVRIVDFGVLCRLKQIYILPDYQGKGYAQEAILLVEAIHNNATNWELDTIKQESKLCYLL